MESARPATVGEGVTTHSCLEVLPLVLVVVVAEVDELGLQLVLELLEGLDGLLPGGMGRAELDGLGGGLLGCVLVSSPCLPVQRYLGN